MDSKVHLGIAAVDDKIVQQAVVTILNQIYEEDFLGFSYRVADPRILRLIRKWLKAGVMEEGKWSEPQTGTPQGSVISPLLANIYLHYSFDLWVNVWRRKYAQGEVVAIRYADDTIAG